MFPIGLHFKRAQGHPVCKRRKRDRSSEGRAPYRTSAHASAWEGSSPGSHQPQEGGTQEDGDEPAQHAPSPAAPPGARHRLRLILRWGFGREKPLPGSLGPGPTAFQFQLQLGGSRAAVLLPSGFSEESRELQALPRPRASRAGGLGWRHLPGGGPSPGRGLELLNAPGVAGSGGAPSQTQGACPGHVAEMWPPANHGLASNRKLIGLPRTLDAALGPQHHT
uniref:Translation initiation factor IF-2-like n=1 Tax=Tursiops truncatus TaxID=9739 RepID=A0A6J3S8T7_TURTR|nr:translation initiation factor IF-2-like [Tursiops truncatus]